MWSEVWTIKLFEPQYGIGIGAGPSVSIKYNFAPKYSCEMRGAFAWDDPEIIVFGGRLYYNFTQISKGVFYTGGELNYTKFNYQSPANKMNEDIDIKGISGNGYTLSFFVGGEYFIDENDKFSLISDIGPIFTNIKDECGDSTKEWDWVVNVGILCYPFGGKEW